LHHREGNVRALRCDAMLRKHISGQDLIAFVAKGPVRRNRGEEAESQQTLNRKVRFLISAPKTHSAGYFAADIGYNSATRDATRVQTQICKNRFRPDPKHKPNRRTTRTRRDTKKEPQNGPKPQNAGTLIVYIASSTRFEQRQFG